MALSGRSFEVEFNRSGYDDITRTSRGAPYFIEAFDRLRDRDILDWKALPVPPTDEGSWVYFRLGDSIVMAQWDAGNRALWDLGMGRGILKVVRVIEPDDFTAVVESLMPEDE